MYRCKPNEHNTKLNITWLSLESVTQCPLSAVQHATSVLQKQKHIGYNRLFHLLDRMRAVISQFYLFYSTARPPRACLKMILLLLLFVFCFQSEKFVAWSISSQTLRTMYKRCTGGSSFHERPRHTNT